MTKQRRDDECKHIFVLGHDQKHQADVEQIHDAAHVAFHPLLHSDEIVNRKDYDIEGKLGKAREILNRHEKVDGIVCHWDFPVTSMHAILCEEYGLRGPSLRSLIKCEHKYWSRIEQQKVSPETTPAFCAVDPFAENPLEQVSIDYPFWLKPVKGYASMLGFHIRNEADFHKAIEQTRKTIHDLGDPFTEILERLDLPEELAGIDGNAMIAEQFVRGHEFAPEGYVQNGECHVHGLVDMVIGANGKSFERYEYPSTAPSDVQQRAIELSSRIMKHMGFDNGCFNIEFFWDKEQDRLWLIEINPRISQSHSYLFEKVNGMSNHEIAVSIALGIKPHFDRNRGPYERAAKFLHRRYDKQNLIAEKVPDKTDIEHFHKIQPDTEVYPRLKEGTQLKDTVEQDPYSYVLADILIAAHSQEELEEKYRVAADNLPFKFAPVKGDRPGAGA